MKSDDAYKVLPRASSLRSGGALVQTGKLDQHLVQFATERTPEGWVLNPPIILWCFWPPEPRRDYECATCKFILRVTPESMADFPNEVLVRGLTLKHSPKGDECVCLCLGKVIE